MPANYITLTRQSLYELVWSKPMSTLAKEFGITDVGLAKRCRTVDVPIPYRGYWARKEAGQNPPRLPLPKYRRTEPVEPRKAANAAPVAPVREGPEPTFHHEVRAPKPETPKSVVSLEHQALDAKLSHSPAAVRTDLRDAHSAVRRTALHLKASKVQDLDWKRGERAGPILHISVDSNSVQRALRVADGLLRAAESIGWTFEAPPKNEDPWHRQSQISGYSAPVWGCIQVEQEPVQITIIERRKQVPHVLTKYEKDSQARGYHTRPAPWDLAYTGDLRLNLVSKNEYVLKTFADRAKRRLEEQLPDVMHAMLEHALEEKRRREQQRIEEEAERERQRLAGLARERREAHSKLVVELERQVGAWYRARLLRSYIRAAKRATGSRPVKAMLQQQSLDFLDWASSYADQLDPLSPVPRNPDQTPQRSMYGDEDAALKSTLHRLFSTDSHLARKLAFETTAAATAERDEQEASDEDDDEYADEYEEDSDDLD
jgi:hypothetical protein